MEKVSSIVKAVPAGSIDIEVSDTPDPFYPQKESNVIVINSVGNNSCKLTFSIENTGRSWQWENLASGGSVQVVWDGKNIDGNFVSVGTYNYTAFCVQNYNNPIGLSTFNKIISYIIPTAFAFFSDTETGTIAVSSAENVKTIIDFEGLPCFTPVATQYSNLGVNFSGAIILAKPECLRYLLYPPFSGVNVIYDDPTLGGMITATFSSVVGNIHKVSAYVTGNRNVTLTAFSITGAVLATTQTGGPNYIGAGTGIPVNLPISVESSATPIARVTFHDSGDTYTVDDFTFDTSSVAIPIYGIPPEFTFKNNLSEGSSAVDVRYLQIILNSDSRTRVASISQDATCWNPVYTPGAQGCENGIFGPSTKAAVKKFQEKYADVILTPLGLTEGTGYVGGNTMIMLNKFLKADLLARKIGSITILDRAGRENAIVNSFTEESLKTLMPEFHKVLLLSIAAHETGGGYELNNEWTRVNSYSEDYGRGIMQITTNSVLEAAPEAVIQKIHNVLLVNRQKAMIINVVSITQIQILV